MEFDFSHEFACTADLYWELFFDADFNVDMFRRLHMKEYSVLSWQRDGDTIRRSQRLVPERQIPGPFRKALGGEFGYVENDVCDRARSSMDVAIVPTVMSERFAMHGLFTVQPVAPGQVRRSFRGSLKVSFPLLGGQIEKFIHADMKESYGTAAGVTREWIDRWKQAGTLTGTPPRPR